MSDDPAPPPMTTSLEVDGAGACLIVAGEVDLLMAPEFVAALTAAQDAARAVVVDLRAVGFMDSTGLRALLEGRVRSASGGGRLALRLAAGGPVERLLDLAGVLTLFDAPDGA